MKKKQKNTCYTVTLTPVSTRTSLACVRHQSRTLTPACGPPKICLMPHCFLFPGPQFYILHPPTSWLLWLQYTQVKVIPTGNICEKCSQFTELLSVLLCTFQAVADVSPVLFIAFLMFPQAGRALKQMRAISS